MNDATSDNAFDPLPDRFVTVTTTDNDVFGFVVTETGNSTIVSEAGVTDTVTLALTAQPSSNVVFTISMSNTQASVAPTSLTFTSVNWEVPQRVIVSGSWDLFPDNQGSDLRITVNDAVSDNAFDPLPDRVISVVVTDSVLPGG